MQAWGAWFGSLGDAVTDPGNPFAGSATVSASGTLTKSTPECMASRPFIGSMRFPNPLLVS